ncbi:MAG: hypothetical protein ACE147_00235 [Candidatus Methylomirabilales bacterium]
MSQDGEKGGRRRRPQGQPREEPTSPRWAKEAGTKVCRKCGGRMFPADWIWQKYGLCVGWRCSKCKEKVMARSLPFKGLRKRPLDPDEAAARGLAPPEAPAGAGPDEAAEEPRPARRPGAPPPRRSPRRRK